MLSSQSTLHQNGFSRTLLKSYRHLLPHFIVALLLAGTISAQPAKEANKFLGCQLTFRQYDTIFPKYWNQVTGENECIWAAIEGSRDSMNWSAADSLATFARRNNIPWTFNALLANGAYARWVSSIGPTLLLEEIEEWMDSTSSRYPDPAIMYVVTDDIQHFPGVYRDALGGAGSTGYDWIIKAFTMARQRWPNAILILNDYNNIEYENAVQWTLDLLTVLKNANAPIDAIGCQAHDAWKQPADILKNNIDRLAAIGYPILITEYDIDTNNDDLQDSIMQEQFTLFWNHPKIVGVTYWGYIVGKTWRNSTGLMTTEGVERPALTWLKNYVAEHPNPPNDFPEMLNFGTAAIPPPHVPAPVNSTINHSNSRLFNLQGRFAGLMVDKNGVLTPPTPGKSNGLYIQQYNGQSLSSVKIQR